MHLFNFGIDSGQKLLQHETCGLPSCRPPAGKRQPLKLGRADYTRQTTEDSPLRVVLFPSLRPSVRPSRRPRSVLAVGRSFGRSVGRSPPLSPPSLTPFLPFLQLLPVRSSAVGKGREQAISSACQVGITRSRAAVQNRAIIHVPNCQAQKSRLSRPCRRRRRSTQNRNSAAAKAAAAAAGAISIVFP